MRKVYILYQNFYTNDGKEISVGGIQTYIKMLCEVINKNNMIPIIFQYGNHSFKNNYHGIDVYGVHVKETWSTSRKSRILYNECKKNFNDKEDIIIIATDFMGVTNSDSRVIGIQHGINFDVRKSNDDSFFSNLKSNVIRLVRAYKTVLAARKFKLLVAVDYNFLNWYRTMPISKLTDIRVVPNCTVIKDLKKVETKKVNIIFARRFFEHRGTRLFASVLNRLFVKYENISATFAGSGPDEMYLREIFASNPRVNFTTYDSNESLEFHKEFDIAVVPTLGSEGTSLSLLEAMAAKCAVVATNVGGMTNIILDHYNGLLINPKENELYESLELLIQDTEMRNTLSQNAYHSVSQAFNKDLWDKRWTKILEEVIKE